MSKSLKLLGKVGWFMLKAGLQALAFATFGAGLTALLDGGKEGLKSLTVEAILS